MAAGRGKVVTTSIATFFTTLALTSISVGAFFLDDSWELGAHLGTGWIVAILILPILLSFLPVNLTLISVKKELTNYGLTVTSIIFSSFVMLLSLANGVVFVFFLFFVDWDNNGVIGTICTFSGSFVLFLSQLAILVVAILELTRAAKCKASFRTEQEVPLLAQNNAVPRAANTPMPQMYVQALDQNGQVFFLPVNSLQAAHQPAFYSSA
eukprot:TRINITY_DN6232_c1_g1_i1.p1 TRINITY_DN6232_c1_g1~~TRINITY_DN6232_c1_g1_i1.p1  ORF type:complete len:210 (+),score=27.28 TRINITY_DN6232_c1_g1_i1:131-760(+)